MKTKMTALLLACCLALNAMAGNLEIENLERINNSKTKTK